MVCNSLLYTVYNIIINILITINVAIFLGAGKSTLISCISGLTSITSGNAWILGKNINSLISQEMKKMIGICGQYDVLFPLLTVKEHLEFYARLKGISKKNINNHVLNMIDKIDLRDRMNYLPNQLSGGMKRKLSLAIAFIGDSKIILLDECTNGMDVKSRRLAWDIIEKEKKNRTIILTTHFLDEADMLYVIFIINFIFYSLCAQIANVKEFSRIFWSWILRKFSDILQFGLNESLMDT